MYERIDRDTLARWACGVLFIIMPFETNLIFMKSNLKIQTKSLSTQQKDNYVVVDQKDDNSADEKTLSKIPALRAILSTFKVGKGGVRPKLNNLRTKIWNSGAAGGSASTLFNTVVALSPSACTEFSTLATIYDEAKCHGVAFHFSTLVSSTSSAAITMHGNVVYDPVDATAYTDILTSLSASQKMGPFALGSNQWGTVASGNSWATGPSIVSKKGMYLLKCKIPKGITAPSFNGFVSTITNVEGQWYPMVITAGIERVGYVKPYLEANTNCTFQWEYYIEYDMEFRSRT
jgi:hypothetical protein